MSVPHIDRYEFGKITIDGSIYTKDVILLPSRTISNWWRKEGHLLHVSDLQEVMIANPQVLIVGQGAYGRMAIKSEVEDALQSVGIDLISLPTKEACQEYNHISAEQKVAAALHLTC